MKSAFIGGTKRGYLTLKALLESGADVAGIVSLEQDAHEVERYEEPIRALAAARGIPLHQTKWMKDRDYGALLVDEWRADLVVAVGCRILFPREVHARPRLGCVGVHDSLLPEYRGFAPLNWAILNGEDHTGVTLFYLGDLMDGGDIVAQRRIPVGPDETAPEVYERVCDETVKLVIESYPLFASGTAPRRAQRYDEGSFTCSRNPLDGWIEWERPAREIHNLVRALTAPYPGAFTVYEGRRLFVWRTRMIERAPRYVGRVPGRIVGVSATEGHVDVLAGDGVLRLSEVQLDGGPRMAAANVLKSVRGTLGVRGADLIQCLAALKSPGTSA
ncbi:MAG: methionyl-tRNA formyltransferase [Verrucomicrobia bacterium]|nr:methionyl-tRNA formyltransferase [Verrucomicrobiota bacterium]